MKTPDLLDDRFELELAIGSGGMGSVYRARDRESGDIVAVKVLHGSLGVDRFEQEARVLAELRHPGIVRYVAHRVAETDEIASGRALSSRPYLAMEWLEGEDLEKRLARGRPTVRESVELFRLVANALATAHARAVVHRDIKPSNVFLVGGSLAQPKILDFGIALGRGEVNRQTLTGTALGTPGYMAPEQARGDRDVDARADVFSLGCLLFECLTGRAAFSGGHVMAILAKILLEEAPHVRELASDVPSELDALVTRMLAKDRNARPADAAVVLAELEALTPVESRPALTPRSVPSMSLSRDEQRMVSVVVLTEPATAEAATLAVGDTSSAVRPIVDVVRAFNAQIEFLRDGSLVASLPGGGAATDQAARAAGFALALRAISPNGAMAVATGRAERDARAPVGEAIDHAVSLIRRGAGATLEPRPAGEPLSSSASPTPPPIRIDSVTAGLLDERFQRRSDESGVILVGQRDADGMRTLLGSPTPCVGRETELATLESIFAQCASEPVARAIVVTAPAGVGKSRLRYEFLRKVRARGEKTASRSGETEVWTARGDPLGAGSSFGLAAQVIRRAAGILEGEPLEAQREKLRARVERHVPPENRARVAEFLGELIGAMFSDEANPKLKAARRDAILMGDQIRRAWEDFIDAETLAHPVVLCIEDLHWGDLPTVSLVDSALRLFPERPLLVLAFARPDVDDLFPSLWSERDVHRMSLVGLTRKAGEKLVKSVLGNRLNETEALALVDRAAGNAFYLEELIRAVAEGRGEALPETVLAMIEARLDALEPEARRLLRAASVFGPVFWEEGAFMLFGDNDGDAAGKRWLSELTRREIVTRRGAGRLASQVEYTFRHALVREAAYAMLTDADRILGHRLAAGWLERTGETDPMLLGEHFERGGEPARAAEAFLRGAGDSLEGNDFEGAVKRIERGKACGAAGELLGKLTAIGAQAEYWIGRFAESERDAEVALSLFERGSEPWGHAAELLATVCGRLGRKERLHLLAEDLLDLHGTMGLGRACRSAAARVASSLFRLADPIGGVVLEAAAALDPASNDLEVRAQIEYARGIQALCSGDPGEFLKRMMAVVPLFEEGGDARQACWAQSGIGYGLLSVGAFAESQRWLEAAHAVTQRMGLTAIATTMLHNLGYALACLGRLDDGIRIEKEAAEAFNRQGDQRLEAACRLYLVMIFVEKGELALAEVEAEKAIALSGVAPLLRPHAYAALAHARLAASRPEGALVAAREAMAALDALGAIEEGEGLIRLVFAETLFASGDRDSAREAIGIARERLLQHAAKITDAAYRASFLESVPEHRKTLALAKAWNAADSR